MKPNEVASLLGVGYYDVIKLIGMGYLSATRYGKNDRFYDIDPASVSAEIERRRIKHPKIEPPNPSGLCLCGCGRPVPRAQRTSTADGLKAGEFVRYLPGHQPNKTALSAVRYLVDPTSGCWVWQRSLTPEGYPKRMSADGHSYVPHRYYYQVKYGPIPAGYQLDHLCRNRACVNPDHLEAVTPAVNVRRSAATKLAEDDVRSIKHLFRQGTTKSELGQRFAVTVTNICEIINGTTWKGIEPTE